jgi:hypothetical protein
MKAFSVLVHVSVLLRYSEIKNQHKRAASIGRRKSHLLRHTPWPWDTTTNERVELMRAQFGLELPTHSKVRCPRDVAQALLYPHQSRLAFRGMTSVYSWEADFPRSQVASRKLLFRRSSRAA